MNDEYVTTARFCPMPAKNLGRFIDKFAAETEGVEALRIDGELWAFILGKGDDPLVALVCRNGADHPSHFIKGDAELVRMFLDCARHNQRMVPRYPDRIPLSINVVK
ncbi:MAG: hypothetical protein U9Q03_01270 [Patescibacteria group bacterium]|nr:hypothetical protein [Patescibacteria group bacterium]